MEDRYRSTKQNGDTSHGVSRGGRQGSNPLGGYYPNVQKNGEGALVVPESSTREIISFGDEEPDPAEYAGGKASPSRTPCCSHLWPFQNYFFRDES